MSREMPLYGFGGGGASLNFRVKAYASAEALPETAAENTIAVITSTAITGYIFSTTAPTEPAEGMVWVETALASAVAFSATKKNPVMIYPLTARQYVGGAWVDTAAYSFLDGAWKQWWTGVLYDSGDEYESFTGGWEQKHTSGTYSKGTVTKEETYIELSTTSSKTITSIVGTVNKVDVTSYKTLYAEILSCTSGRKYRVGLSSGEEWNTADLFDLASFAGDGDTGTVSCDISGVTGECYVAVRIGHESTMTRQTLQIGKVWME